MQKPKAILSGTSGVSLFEGEESTSELWCVDKH